MSTDGRTIRDRQTARGGQPDGPDGHCRDRECGGVPEAGSADSTRERRPAAPVSEDSRLATEIRRLVEQGEMDGARDRFGRLVASNQRRAIRIAYQYLRDAAEADEAVQDAFVKVFAHITSYRDAWPFEVWFTRILINGCLDRRKARARRDRWFVGSGDAGPADEAHASVTSSADANPEARLLARERRARLAAAIDRLDGRQRTVFMLCHYGDCTPREVSAMTGLNESTVRVHLFRAARKLRGLLGGKP
jgi:RNA polymerase sigma-70 factor (ECF subfamily)